MAELLNYLQSDDNYSDKLRQKGLKSGEADRKLSSDISVSGGISGTQFTPTDIVDEDISAFISPEEAADVGGYQDIRAREQGFLSTVGGITGQTLSEFILGTVGGFGTMAGGIADTFSSAFGAEETNFAQQFDSVIQEAKEYIAEEVAPIYQTHAQEKETFNPYSANWWAKNSPQIIGSALSFLVPAKATGALVGKAISLGGRSRKLEIAGNIIGSAYASRYMENVQEANGARQASIDRNLSKGLSYEEANRLASKEAASTFSRNMALLGIDALQFGSSFINLNFANRILKAGKKASGFILNAGSEGFEEAYQTISQKEAQLQTETPEKYYTSSIWDRISDYAMDDEVRASALLGAAGGIGFELANPIGKAIVNKKDELDSKIKNSLFKNDKYALKLLKDKQINSAILRNLKQGKPEHTDEIINNLKNLPKEVFERMGSDKSQFDNEIKLYEADSKAALDLHTELDSDDEFKSNPQAKYDYIAKVLDNRVSARNLSEMNSGLNNMYSSISSSEAPEIDPKLVDYKKMVNKINALKKAKKSIKSLRDSFGKKIFSKSERGDISNSVDNRINRLSKKLLEIKESIKSSNPELYENLESKIISSKDSEISKLEDNIVNSELAQDFKLRPELRKYENFKNRKEIAKLVDEINKKSNEVRQATLENEINNAETAEDVENILKIESAGIDNSRLYKVANDKSDQQLSETGDVPELRFRNGLKDFVNNLSQRYDGKPHLMQKEMMGNLMSLLEKNKKYLPIEAKRLLRTYKKDENKTSSKAIITLNGVLNESLKRENKTKSKPLVEKINNFFKSQNDLRDRIISIGDFKSTDNPQTETTEEKDVSNKEDSRPQEQKINVADFIGGEFRIPDACIVPEFEMEYDASTKKYKIIYGQGGLPVDGRVKSLLSQPIDYSYVNNGSLLTSKTVSFAINLDIVNNTPDDYHKGLATEEDKIERCEILVYHTDPNGNKHLVNALPPYFENNPNESENNKLLDLRKSIWNTIKHSGNTTGIIDSGITNQIKKILPGMIVNVRGAANSPSKLTREGDKLILGVAVNSVSGGPVSLKVGENAPDGYSDIYINSAEKPGTVYAILKSPNGQLVPIKLLTRKLSESQEVLDKVLDLFTNTNKDNWTKNRKDIRSYSYIDYNYKPDTDSFDFFYGKKGKKSMTNIKRSDTGAIKGLVEDFTMQIDANKINSTIGGEYYNDMISNQNRLATNLFFYSPIANSGFTIDLNPETSNAIASKNNDTNVKYTTPTEGQSYSKKEYKKPQKAKLESQSKTVSGEEAMPQDTFNTIVLKNLDKAIKSDVINIIDLMNGIYQDAGMGDELDGVFTVNAEDPSYKKYDSEITKIYSVKSIDDAIKLRNRIAQTLNIDPIEIKTDTVEPAETSTEDKAPKGGIYLKGELRSRDSVANFIELHEKSINDSIGDPEVSVENLYSVISASGIQYGSEDSQAKFKEFLAERLFGDSDTTIYKFLDSLESKEPEEIKPEVIEKGTINLKEPIPEELIAQEESFEDDINLDDYDVDSGLGDNDIDELLGGLTTKTPRLVSDNYNKTAKSDIDWFKSRFPQIPLRIVKGLIEVNKNGGLQAWGAFNNGVVYLSENAADDTLKHESFHAVFNLYLNNDERNQLLLEAKELYGLPNKDQFNTVFNSVLDYFNSEFNRNPSTEEVNNLWLEEQMAEDLIEDVNTNSNLKFPKRIKNFFKDIFYIIKSRLTGKISIGHIYSNIRSGRYKNKQFKRDISKLVSYRIRIPGMTNQEAKERSVMLSNIFSDILDKYESAENKNQYISRRDVLLKYGSGRIANDVVKVLMAQYKANKDSWSNIQLEEFKKLLSNFAEVKNGAILSIRGLGKKMFENLKRTEGFSVDLKSVGARREVDSIYDTDNDINSIDENSRQLESWQMGKEHYSKRESLTSSVKKALSRISIPGKTDIFGFNTYLDFDRAFATLIKEMSDSYTSTDMLSKMEAYSALHTDFLPLYERMNDDVEFRQDFFNAMHNTFVDYKFIKETTLRTKDGESVVMSVGSSNRTNTASIISNSWKSNFKAKDNNLANADGSVNNNNIKRLLNSFKEARKLINPTGGKIDINPSGLSKLASVMNKLGIEASSDDLSILSKEILTPRGKKISGKTSMLKLLNELENIIASLNAGKNIFESTDKTIFKSINNISNIVATARLDLYESSFRNSERKTVYAHQVPFELSQWFARLKGNDNEAWLDSYLNSVYFKHSPWLRNIRDNINKYKNIFEFIQFDGLQHKTDKVGTTYSNLSGKNLEEVGLSMYFNNNDEQYAYYRCPVFSNAPRGVFVKYDKFTNEEVLDQLFEVAKQELDRINNIKIRENQRKVLEDAGEEIPLELQAYKNYDSEASKKFNLLYFLNDNLEDNIALIESGKDEDRDKIISLMQSWIESESKKDLKRLVGLGVIEKTIDNNNQVHISFSDNRMGRDQKLADNHKSYFYNSLLANTQLMTIFTGDVAFYKPDAKDSAHRSIDFSKRSKEIVSPKHILNTDAFYEISEQDRLNEGLDSNIIYCGKERRGIYLKDVEEIDPIRGKVMYQALRDSGSDVLTATRIAANYGYTNTEKDGIQYAKATDGTMFKTSPINIADGQTFISLQEFRKKMIGANKWNRSLQESYMRLINKRGNAKDIDFFIEQVKPFMFGVHQIGDLKVPIQHKNSEFVVFPQLGDKSPYFKKILDLFESRNIDFVSYDSVVKCGLNGVANNIDEATDAPIHTISNEFYGIQQETPEHLVDHHALLGTQIRKLILSDLSPNAVFKIGNALLNKQQLVDLYQGLLYTNVKESFEEIVDDKNELTPNRVSELLTEELDSRGYGDDLKDAIQVVSKVNPLTGKEESTLNVPLFLPNVAQELESVVHAIFKSRVTKQEIKGGAVVQVSGIGFKDDLNIVFKEDADIEGLKEGETRTGIDYLECIMPWHTKEYIKPLLDENGLVDINKIEDPELLNMIGYRIPTEALYSMAKLKVVDFLPRESTSSIILPREITTLSGSDFDIDKMYLMIREFDSNIDYKKIDKVIKNFHKKAVIKGKEPELFMPHYYDIKSIMNKIDEGQSLDYQEKKIYTIYKYLDNDTNLLDGTKTIKSIKPSILEGDKLQKSLEEGTLINDLSKMNIKERNNLIISIMESILGNSTSLQNSVNPGTFATLEDLVIQIQELRGESGEILPTILPSTQTTIFERNMEGLDLVAFAANHNATHAVLQYYDVSLKEPIKFDGHKNSKLDNVPSDQVYSDQPISKNLAEYLAAFVDNAKNPVASLLNINNLTFDVASAITRTGYDLETVALFLNQPILRELTRRAKLAGGSKTDLMNEYDNLINEFTNADIKYEFDSRYNTATDLSKKNMSRMIKDGKLFTEWQLNVLTTFMTYSKNQAEGVSQVTNAVRVDTTTTGPNLAYNEVILDNQDDFIKSKKLENHREILLGNSLSEILEVGFKETADYNPIKLLLSGTNVLNVYDESLKQYVERSVVEYGNNEIVFDGFEIPYNSRIKEIEDYIEQNVNTEFKYTSVYGFNKYGIHRPTEEVSRYYPWLNSSFKGIKGFFSNAINRNFTKEDLTRLNVDILEFKSRNSELLSPDKRINSVFKFPERFKEFVKNNKELAENNALLRKLHYDDSTDQKLPSVIFYNNGSLTKDESQDLKDSWLDLLENSPEISTFAKELAVYTLSRYGFFMSPKTFTRMIPMDYFSDTKNDGNEFVEFLRSIENADTYSEQEAVSFVSQYLSNNINSYNSIKPQFVSYDQDYDGKMIIGKLGDGRSAPLAIAFDENNTKLSNRMMKEFSPGIFVPVDIIGVKLNKNNYALKRTFVEGISENIHVYTLIEPRGVNDEFVEYTQENSRSRIPNNRIDQNSENKMMNYINNPESLMNAFGYGSTSQIVKQETAKPRTEPQNNIERKAISKTEATPVSVLVTQFNVFSTPVSVVFKDGKFETYNTETRRPIKVKEMGKKFIQEYNKKIKEFNTNKGKEHCK